MWSPSLLQVLLAGRDDLPWWHADSGRDEPPAERVPGAWAPASARQGRRRPTWRAASGYGAAFIALLAVAATSLLLLAPAPIDDSGQVQHQVSEERHERIREALLKLGAEDVRSRESGGVLHVEYRIPNETALTPAAWQAMALEVVAPLVPEDVSLVLVQHAGDASGNEATSTLAVDPHDLDVGRQRGPHRAPADAAGVDPARGDGGQDAADDTSVQDDEGEPADKTGIMEEPLADGQ